MSDLNKYIPHASPTETTVSFGMHRHPDRPASAMRAGGTTMPLAWQTRGIANSRIDHYHDQPIRSFADLALDPLRWCVATKGHAAIAVAGVVGLSLIIF